MVAKVETITQDEIGYGTHLQANVILFHFLHQRRTVRDVETVAYTLRPEGNRVVQIMVIARVGLAGVKVKIQFLTLVGRLLLTSVQDMEELLDSGVIILLTDQIEANDHICVVLSG